MHEKKINILHICILILGIIFLISGSFHTNLWFDESYTVGLMSQNLVDLCKVATYDVHPLLYYIILRIYGYVFGTSLIALRLFSALCAILLMLLGYTHIRKDFGAKTGVWFSFLIIVMPSTFKYASQIRMYTCAPLFVTLAAIYVYRMIYHETHRLKNTILFLTFSIMSAYTHYYGLMAVSIINILVLIYYLKFEQKMKKWFVIAAIQLIGYLPGLYVFFQQLKISDGSWINVGIHSFFDSISFHFLGVPQNDLVIGSPIHIIGLVIGLCVYIYMGYIFFNLRKESKSKTKPATLALLLYFGVIIVFLVISIIKPIYYVRYLMISYGLLIFAFAFLLARVNQRYFKMIMVMMLLSMTVLRAIPIYQGNYDSTNSNIDNYLKENMKEGDIFVFDSAGVFSVSVKYQNIPTYFYNAWDWNIEKCYKAFGYKVSILDNLEPLRDYSGRIWIFNKGVAYDEIMSWYGTREISSENVKIKYYDSKYVFVLIEKK